MTISNELEALIAEQEKDKRYGSRIYHESIVALSLDGSAGLNHTVSDFLSNEGLSLKYGHTAGCPLHGLSGLGKKANGRNYCRTCHQNSKNLRYKTDPDYKASVLSSAAEKYRTDKAYREKRKAQMRERYHAVSKDPEWKAKENDRQRRARARKKYGL